MTNEQLDVAVRRQLNTRGRALAGKEYSSHGAKNSNRFVYDVVTRAGGKMPRGPGICGGDPDSRLAAGNGCSDS
jgi:hypothetical protein